MIIVVFESLQDVTSGVDVKLSIGRRKSILGWVNVVPECWQIGLDPIELTLDLTKEYPRKVVLAFGSFQCRRQGTNETCGSVDLALAVATLVIPNRDHTPRSAIL